MVAIVDERTLGFFKNQSTISGGRNKLNKLIVEIDIMHLEDNYNSLCKSLEHNSSEIIPPGSAGVYPSVAADKGGFTSI